MTRSLQAHAPAWHDQGVQSEIPAVSVDDVPAELPTGAVLLDVREDEEWTAGHAPTAVHLPMSGLPGTLSDVPQAEQLYVICRSGGRSAQVTAFLNANGHQAVNVSGGMQSWAASGRPMASESGAAPAVV